MVEAQTADLIFSKRREFVTMGSMSNEELKAQINNWWKNTRHMLLARQQNEFENLLAELNKRL